MKLNSSAFVTFRRSGLFLALSTFAGSALAEPASLEIEYTCIFPVVEEQTLSVVINADIPHTAMTGELTPAFDISADATVSEESWNGLYFLGARPVSGSVSAASSISGPNLNANLNIPLNINRTTLPDERQTFVTSADGQTPPLVLQEGNVGDVGIRVGDLILNLDPLAENDNFTGLGQIESTCTLNPGQSSVLQTIRVKSANGGGEQQVDGPVSGLTVINANSTQLPLNGSFSANILDGAVDGTLALEPTEGEFRIVRLFNAVRLDAQVEFTDIQPVSGNLSDSGQLTLTTSAYLSVPAFQLKYFGFTVAEGGGSECRTLSPVNLSLTSLNGGSFSIENGGTVAGNYSVPQFENCWNLDRYLNRVMSGSDNVIQLNLNTGN